MRGLRRRVHSKATCWTTYAVPRYGHKPYPCKFCPDRFARSDLLSRHVNKAHGGSGTGGKDGTTRMLTSGVTKKKMGGGGGKSDVQKNGHKPPTRVEVGGLGDSRVRCCRLLTWEDLPYDDGMAGMKWVCFVWHEVVCSLLTVVRR